MTYTERIASLEKISFSDVKNVAKSMFSGYSQSELDELHAQLSRGTAIIEREVVLNYYLRTFGNQHEARLLDAFENIPRDLLQSEIEIIDWGCGQAIGSMVLLDHIRSLTAVADVKRITLIEVSESALERAVFHIRKYLGPDIEIKTINKYFEDINTEELASTYDCATINIFSHILDVKKIDLKHTAKLLDSASNNVSYNVCVSPLFSNARRLDNFLLYFNVDAVYAKEDPNFGIYNKWKYKCINFQLFPSSEGNLFPIKFYPAVPFQAIYELDIIRFSNEKKDIFVDSIKHFNVLTPFDIGASAYEDVEPIYAVINNIVTRGFPTISSPYIEDAFSRAFGKSKQSIHLGSISYPAEKDLDFSNFHHAYLKSKKGLYNLDDEEKVHLQLLLSPIAISRLHKTIIEALISGKIDIHAPKLKVLIEEKDIPFAITGIEDFKQLFNSICELSETYQSLRLPEIDLTVVGSSEFKSSPLHQGKKTFTEPNNEVMYYEYDMVISLSMLDTFDENKDHFKPYKAKNNCYFSVSSGGRTRQEHAYYTSSLINYQNIVNKKDDGSYQDIQEKAKTLSYLVQYLFRKASFRPGQLPILDRALRNLPVIGLLPTGGGKSLTYQFAALLQPGITLIIDPLKSLMHDQFNGLQKIGINGASYINSSLTSNERKKREESLQKSQYLMMFVSPERLFIKAFRQKLADMHLLNAYFAYGVVDEVHCVSEWGHDFRFSYLHLGRNLYNFVKPKNGHISLIGLTATASFDVLADVERELSSHGDFELDSDATIRYENTNRLELQYKIHRVPIEVEPNPFFNNVNYPDELPRPIGDNLSFAANKSKQKALAPYLKHIPSFIEEIQTEAAIAIINEKFKDRQVDEISGNIDIQASMGKNYYVEQDTYNHSGIIFCPHVTGTDISVSNIHANLIEKGFTSLGRFSGRDNDTEANKNLDDFRANKYPLMVATKAFGMGIDKPNVRFTINMNYSSSLESFVQEAGRAGRDKKMAIASIFVSDYKLLKISRDYQSNNYPIPHLRNKWYNERDMLEVIDNYNLEIPKEYLLEASPENDLVKLHCSVDHRMFAFLRCDNTCSLFNKCSLKNASRSSRGWMTEQELHEKLIKEKIHISKRDIKYFNPDHQSNIHFFNESFKGEKHETSYINRILNVMSLDIRYLDGSARITSGFLESFLELNEGEKLNVNIPYINDKKLQDDGTHATNTEVNRYSDLAKAIYRMTLIGLIEDFTQHYNDLETGYFEVLLKKKPIFSYYNQLKLFFLKYYNEERAELELEKAKKYNVIRNEETFDSILVEIYKCLTYLTHFVYDKISEKRKRAIDDMQKFCLMGFDNSRSWLEINEDLKDDLFFYFNSKYARDGYTTENGEPYSLVDDTKSGKDSNTDIVIKYLMVTNEFIYGSTSNPLDSIKHLYGAVRLISRSLTDRNPSLELLEAYCLVYLRFKNNENLKFQFYQKLTDGLMEMWARLKDDRAFWKFYKLYMESLEPLMIAEGMNDEVDHAFLLIQNQILKNITNNYLS